MTDRTGLPAQHCQDSTARTGHLEQDSQDRKAGTGQPEKESPNKNSPIVSIGLPGQDSSAGLQCRTARTGLPGHDFRNRIARADSA
jgi:hypothetical protein